MNTSPAWPSRITPSHCRVHGSQSNLVILWRASFIASQTVQTMTTLNPTPSPFQTHCHFFLTLKTLASEGSHHSSRTSLLRSFPSSPLVTRRVALQGHQLCWSGVSHQVFPLLIWLGESYPSMTVMGQEDRGTEKSEAVSGGGEWGKPKGGRKVKEPSSSRSRRQKDGDTPISSSVLWELPMTLVRWGRNVPFFLLLRTPS